MLDGLGYMGVQLGSVWVGGNEVSCLKNRRVYYYAGKLQVERVC